MIMMYDTNYNHMTINYIIHAHTDYSQKLYTHTYKLFTSVVVNYLPNVIIHFKIKLFKTMNYSS